MILLLLPFALQATLILIDEFYYHWRRGLPTWEIWGHPLDTFFSLLPFLYAARVTPDESTHLWIYGLLAGFSCLFITKDEFIHREICPPGEAWIHAMLFILHPLTFAAAAWIWISRDFRAVLPAQAAIMFLFMLYQLVTWGILWRTRERKEPRPAGR